MPPFLLSPPCPREKADQTVPTPAHAWILGLLVRMDGNVRAVCTSLRTTPQYLGIGWDVGTTGTNLGQLAICSCTFAQDET